MGNKGARFEGVERAFIEVDLLARAAFVQLKKCHKPAKRTLRSISKDDGIISKQQMRNEGTRFKGRIGGNDVPLK